MPSDPDFDQAASVSGFIQRAELMAGLGRYDEAAEEVGLALALEPGHVQAWTVLARVRLAAGQPAEALAAAESALGAAADPSAVPLPALVVRGLALVDLRRFPEAAGCADDLLRLGAADGYAQCSAAALLAEARNGQPALNAAWRGVQLAPRDPEAHLVLSLVAARLGLFELAERAYREGLALDPELARASTEVGVVRLERQRYAAALEKITEAMAPESDMTRMLASDTPVPRGRSWLRRSMLLGAGYGIIAVVLVAFLAPGNQVLSRLFAVVAAVTWLILIWRLATRSSRQGAGATLAESLRRERILVLAGYALLVAPGLVLLYALVGTPWPLVFALVATTFTEMVALRHDQP